MEFGGPGRIAKLLNRFLEIVPHCTPTCTTPACVRQKSPPIELHDVDFTTPRPAACGSQRPKRRPQSRTSIDPSAHFKAAVSPLVQSLRHQAGGSVFGLRSASFPGCAGRIELRVLGRLPSRFDDQQPVVARCILRLIPLLLSPNKTLFECPVALIGPAVGVELISPYQLVVCR